MNGTADRDLRAITAAIARHDLDVPFDLAPLHESAPSLLEQLEQHRLVGVAARCHEEAVLHLDTASADALVRLHDRIMAQTLRVELVALRTKDVLDDASVDHRLLKGAALAHTVAVDPADREFRDVDLLVRSHDVDTAVRALTRAGAQRLRPQLRPGFDSRFAKSVTMRFEGVEVDLHRVLDPGPFGVRSFPSDLFVVPQRVRIADREVLTLDRTDHLLHACYHVALGQSAPALTNLRDVALLARGGYDVGRFETAVDRWEARPVIARAVALLRTTLGWEPPESLGGFRPRPGDDALLEPYLGPGDRYPALAAATFRALPPGERLAFARAVGLPSGANPLQRIRTLARRGRSHRR